MWGISDISTFREGWLYEIVKSLQNILWKRNIFLLQKFYAFSFSAKKYFFFWEYFPPFPFLIFLLRSSSHNQNVMESKVKCPHSISRTCLAQEFGLVFHFMIETLPKALRTQGLTALTNNIVASYTSTSLAYQHCLNI